MKSVATLMSTHKYNPVPIKSRISGGLLPYANLINLATMTEELEHF